MSQAAQRYRQRQQHGISVISVPVDRQSVDSALVESGKLRPSQVLQRNAVASALSAVIEEWAERVQWEAAENARALAK